MIQNDIHPEIKSAIRNDSLVLFIGSGFSKNIQLPEWKELTLNFLETLSLKDESLMQLKKAETLDKLKPQDILNILYKKGYKAACQDMLKPLIDIDLSSRDLNNQKELWKISKKIVTTNFDKALESAIEGPLMDEVFIITYQEKPLMIPDMRDSQYLFKIHGSITNPGSCVMFKDDYDNLYKYDHQFLKQLKKLCANATLVFLGYSISDIDIRHILKNINQIFHTSTRHFIISPSKNSFRKYGIETILIDGWLSLPRYLESLRNYRSELDKNLESIQIEVNQQFQDDKSLSAAFDRENQIFLKQDQFLVDEDKKDILVRDR